MSHPKTEAEWRAQPGPWAHLTKEDTDALLAAERSAERNACAAKAREFASHYPVGSDGRNTLMILAEWIEKRALAL